MFTTSPDAIPSPSRRARAERDERLAGRDPDAQLEPFLEGEVADRERRPDRALGVVLVRVGRPEQGHHRIADELLDRAAAPLELGADAVVIRAEERRDSSGSSSSAFAVKPDEVAEEDGDDLSLRSVDRGHGVREYDVGGE